MSLPGTQQHRPPRPASQSPAAVQFLVSVELGVLATLLGVATVCGVALWAIGDGSMLSDIPGETVAQRESADSEQPSAATPAAAPGKDSGAPSESRPDANAATGSANNAATQSTPPAQTSTPPANTSTPPANTSTPPTNTSTPPANTSTPPAQTSTPPAATSTPPAATSTPPADASTPPAATSTPPADTSTPQADTSSGGGALDDVRARNRSLPIAGSGVSGADIALCQIGVTDPKQCELKLEHATFSDSSETTLSLVRRDVANASYWEVKQRATKGLGRPKRVGTFALKSGQLSFTWDAQGVRSYLPFCRLEISATADGSPDSETCQLWKPFEKQPVKMSFTKRDGEQEVSLVLPKETALLPVECLQLEVELADFPSVDLSESIKLKSRTPVKIDHLDPADMTTHLFSTELEFAPKGKSNVLRIKHQAVVASVRKRRGRIDVREEETPIAKSVLKSKRADAEKQLESLDKEIAKIESKIEELANAPQNKGRDKRLEREKKKQTELEDVLVKVEDVLDWIDSAEDAFAEIESDGLIKLWLYRRIADGDEIDILFTN